MAFRASGSSAGMSISIPRTMLVKERSIDPRSREVPAMVLIQAPDSDLADQVTVCMEDPADQEEEEVGDEDREVGDEAGPGVYSRCRLVTGEAARM